MWRPCGSRRGSPPRGVRRCWPTAWRAGATRRLSSVWAYGTRADPSSTTSGSRAPIASGCAEPVAHRRGPHDMPAAAQLAEQPEALGDDVVLVERLEVLLSRRHERVVAQAAV